MLDENGKPVICESSGKRCFTREEAGRIINQKKRNRMGKEIPKRYYFCEECGMWHLTHLPGFCGNGRKRKRKMKDLYRRG